MSPPGATSSTTETKNPQGERDSAESFFLPNFCDPRMVLAVVLISELLALIFTLVRPIDVEIFLTELARISVAMQWLGLTSAALICALRGPLRRSTTMIATISVLALVLVNILVVSAGIVWFGRWLGADALGFSPDDTFSFAVRNMAIGLIVTALLLRYFFVSHQWRHHVEAEARSRIDALQARIRPHFLFNSMNTIASLTRSDPSRAEEAVEDLADLFRATLSDAGRLLSLKEELELSRIYQRIEMLRLGERLRVDWDVADLPMRARLPGLTIQPLLENAIYHGIEPLDSGGTVTIRGSLKDDRIEISVGNPISPVERGESHKGHRIAVDNIRERLRLAFDGRGSLQIVETEGRYEATVRFPVTE